MRRSTPTSVEQLPLFELDALEPARSMRRRRRRGPLRIAVTALALGIATAGMIAGSFAAWTAQTSNPGNSVTSGTLTMSNDKNATSVFAATNVRPGDTGSSTVVVQNTGSVPMSVKLTQDTLSSSGIEASLGLKVYDSTRDWCYWPTNASGTCATFGAWDASSSLTNLALAATDGSAQWPAGQLHSFTISWQLALSSPNSDQGKAGSFRFVWDGTS